MRLRFLYRILAFFKGLGHNRSGQFEQGGILMTIEKVLNAFSGYLKQDTAVEVVETTRGHAVMIWDSRMKDWSDVYHCPTAKVLMNTLLNCKEVFDEEFFTRGERDLADDERVLVAQMRQEMQRLCESDE